MAMHADALRSFALPSFRRRSRSRDGLTDAQRRAYADAYANGPAKQRTRDEAFAFRVQVAARKKSSPSSSV
jgi:hypothetical protein